MLHSRTVASCSIETSFSSESDRSNVQFFPSSWCPLTNLIAAPLQTHVAGIQRIQVILWEPSDSGEHFILEGPASEETSAIVSVSWSPHGCRRALLVARKDAISTVWFQSPLDDSMEYLAPLPAINCWFGSKLQEEPPVVPSAPDQPQTNSTLKTASSISQQQQVPVAPPDMDELQDFFTEEDPNSFTGHIGSFLLDGKQDTEGDSMNPAASASAASFIMQRHHWVRPGMLTAVFVDESSHVTFWRMSVDRTWLKSKPQLLLPELKSRIVLAHAVSALGDTVRVAVVTEDDPSTAHIIEICGSPFSDEASSVNKVARISLPTPQSDGLEGPRKIGQISFLSSGSSLLLLDRPLLPLGISGMPADFNLYRYNQMQIPGTMSAFFDEQPGACFAASSLPFESTASSASSATFCVAEDDSKVILVCNRTLQSLDSLTLQLYSSTDIECNVLDASALNQRRQSCTVAQGLCISSNSCCAAMFEIVQPLDKTLSSNLNSSLCVCVSVLPEAGPASQTMSAALPDDRQLRMNVLRLAWAALRGTSYWDSIQRCIADAIQQDGRVDSGALAKVMDMLDVMWHSFDKQSLPVYLLHLDRIKLALLSQTSGPEAVVLANDFMVRLAAKNMQATLQAISTATLEDPNNQQAMLKTWAENTIPFKDWIHWVLQYFVLLLCSLKRWHATGYDILPGLRLLTDGLTMKRLFFLYKALITHSSNSPARIAADGLFKAWNSAKAVPPSEFELHTFSRQLFQGPFYLHLSSPGPFYSADALRSLVSPEILATIPELSAEEILDRMRALGASSASLDRDWYRDYSMQAESAMKTWMDWRGRCSAETTLILPPVTPEIAESGLNEARALVEGSASARKKRWMKQRALALHPLGMVASSRSKVAAAAALHGHAMYDCLSGKRIDWETGAVTFESVDGIFTTAEFQDTSTESTARSSTPRAWIGSIPPSQSMWKRIKLS
ncbi:hypothetical protein CEUSTIGMA_g655.t1 [Chlamydomonas eustigma]|uniref:Uncharacterized protein n=1 Tax=Chlamydomonas eustigma TaxID=1157962 RepID=A0A250WRA6_9CHLO|nr:hypothetical protein CEUSTIGMA_g655.t1 [Chlamydomonas eustigma]|eukprot:GAX73202.1 hypothetical protein CEUSTIGMA_g655.t1 [Chlamydomonas eustigma]